MAEPNLYLALNFVKMMMSVGGHWPTANPTLFQRFRSYLSLTSVLTFAIVHIADIILNFQNFRAMAENLSVTIPVVTLLFKLITIRVKTSQFLRMMNMMDCEVFRCKDSPKCHKDMIEDLAGQIVSLMKVYWGGCAMINVLYAVLSIMSKDVLPIKLYFDIEGYWIYVVYVFQMSGIMNTAHHTVCLDMLGTSFMGAIISQLDIIKAKMNADGIVKLRGQIFHHNKVIEFVEAFEEVFSAYFLIQYLSSMFTICNIGFYLAHVRPFSGEFIKTLMYFLVMIGQLAFCCWFGNEIIVKSLEIGDACYGLNWINASNSVKKSTIVVMMRALRPLTLTAGKFAHLSLGSLVAILRLSYSYYALMQRLYKDDQMI